eukprot:SM000003S11149  [mRNA]  locus=s3:1239111:1240082:- [translate_table: standard]
MLRYAALMRDAVRVLLGRDDTLRRRTAEIQALTAKLREERLAKERQLEEAALQHVRQALAEVHEIFASLERAEVAVVKLVDRLGEQAEQELKSGFAAQADEELGRYMQDTARVETDCQPELVGSTPAESQIQHVVESTFNLENLEATVCERIALPERFPQERKLKLDTSKPG